MTPAAVLVITVGLVVCVPIVFETQPDLVSILVVVVSHGDGGADGSASRPSHPQH